MNSKMRAVTRFRYGLPDILKIKQIPIPEPAENEVLVEVKAASVNSWDWDMLTGRPLVYRLFPGIFRPYHKILGADFSGIVVKLGKNVQNFKLGDAVLGDISGGNWGSFAEYVCADSEVIIHKPEQITFEQAAAIPQAGILAWQGLRQLGNIKKGDTILINGAGGGVGSFAIQIAKLKGAEVTAVDSGDKFEFMRLLGADYLMNYTTEDYTTTGKKYDYILDVMATKAFKNYRNSLKPAGKMAVVGGHVKTIIQILWNGHLFGRFKKQEIKLLMHQPNSKDLIDLSHYIIKHNLKIIINNSFKLEETPSALQYLVKGKVQGKIVIGP